MTLFSRLAYIELRQFARISKLYPREFQYSQRNLGISLLPLAVILLLFAFIDLILKSRVKNHFVDLPQSHLNLYLIQHLPHTNFYSRFNRLKGKIYLFPLRLFSHLVRGEVSFPTMQHDKFLISLCLLYLKLFVRIFRGCTFYLREDFFSHSSCIVSLAALEIGINAIYIQHGLFDLNSMLSMGLYPGDRIKHQIVFDPATLNCLRQLNQVNAQFYLSTPAFLNRRVDYSAGCERILFVGDSSLSTKITAAKLSSHVALNLPHTTCYYKSHPSEPSFGGVGDIKFLKTYKMKSIHHILFSSDPWIFVGTASTVLYDAHLAGFLVFLINDDKIMSQTFPDFSFPAFSQPYEFCELIRNCHHLPVRSACFDACIEYSQLPFLS